jgi:hypothetical protein
MTSINKRLLIFESHGDSNRCTPCRGKPDQHVTYASHSSPCMPGVRFLRAVPVCDKLSPAPTKSKHAPTPRRSLSNQRQTGSAVILDDLIPPPMRQPWSKGERFWPNGHAAISAYWVHITSMWSVRLILTHEGNWTALNRHSARKAYTKNHYFSDSKLFFYNFFTIETEIKS